jgi:hypothetical protein
MATAGESSPVSKGVQSLCKNLSLQEVAIMHGLCWVLRMCRAELPREFVLRVEGTYWRCFLSDDGSVKLISLKSLVGTEDLPVIELSELQKRVKQLLGIVG